MDQPLAVEGVDGDLGAGVLGHGGVVADVVPVAVGRHDQLERPAPCGELGADPGQRRDRRVDRDRLPAALIGQDLDVRGNRADGPAEELHAGRPPREQGLGQASSFVFMHTKVCPIILLAVPSISRAPRLASVPAMLTSALQFIVVPPSERSVRRIVAVPSTALPGAWPWALTSATSIR